MARGQDIQGGQKRCVGGETVHGGVWECCLGVDAVQ